jgi:hypothetical protein
VLVPGPEEEIKSVRWMYHAFPFEGKTKAEIAKLLNDQGVLTNFGRAWTRATVHEVITNEKYIGRFRGVVIGVQVGWSQGREYWLREWAAGKCEGCPVFERELPGCSGGV